ARGVLWSDHDQHRPTNRRQTTTDQYRQYFASICCSRLSGRWTGTKLYCTLRSDLTELLAHNRDARAVADQVKTVAELLTTIDWEPPQINRKLLVQPHCHQYSIMGFETDRKLLEKLGCDVEISAGCCGLAGNFGMEKGHYDVSVKIAEDGILQK